MSKISILDCTVRDGSYVINYQFSAEDCFVISRALSSSGIELIEVGHGLGVGAQKKGLGKARESDSTYIKSAVEAVSGQSKIGVFYIPGIAEIESIKECVDDGLDFIRIGINSDEFNKAEEAIEQSKKFGLNVSCNLMKSYMVPPEEFARNCGFIEQMGADTVCIVDSAGGMTPNQVSEYVRSTKEKVRIGIGFHGHNNMRLAEANCLAAVEAGATVIDATLRGMGRSAGNPATEIIANLFAREGYDLGNIDTRQLMIIAEEIVAPLLPIDKGLRIEELASGLTYFHSGFQSIVTQASKVENVSCFDTILTLGKEGGSHVTKDSAAEAAKKATAKNRKKSTVRKSSTDGRNWKTRQPENIPDLLKALNETASKTETTPILTVSRSRTSKSEDIYVAPIRVGSGFNIGHIESVDEESDRKIFQEISNISMQVFVDRPIKLPEAAAYQENIIIYDDMLLSLQAIENFIRVRSDIQSCYFPHPGSSISLLMKSRLSHITKLEDENADLGIALFCDRRFNSDDLMKLKIGGTLLLAENSAVEQDVLEHAKAKNIELVRLDLSECLIWLVASLVNSRERIKYKAGRIHKNGLNFVSGGVLGEEGDIILDDINNPRMIYGIADGMGAIKPFRQLEENKQTIALNWLLENML